MHFRIILADDHPFVLLGIRAMLARHAGVMVVGEALTSPALIELLEQQPCDVLVTGLAMPDVQGSESGFELIRRVRRGWPSLRVVAMTGQTRPAMLHAAMSDEAVSVFGKAESMETLWHAIQISLNGGRYLGQTTGSALASRQDCECCPASWRRLSWRQAEVLRRLVNGQNIAEIAAALGCGPRTVSRQKRAAMATLGVATHAALFSYLFSHLALHFALHLTSQPASKSFSGLSLNLDAGGRAELEAHV